MKVVVLLLLLISVAGSARAQTKPNPALKRELDSLYAADQRWRLMLFDRRISRRPDSLATALGVPKDQLQPYIIGQMLRTDSANLVRVRALVKQYGYPGKSLVGEPTNETVWNVIQHSDAIKQYLPLIKKAAAKGELPFRLYAQMLDRQLMRDGKAQLYGTQGMSYSHTNRATGQREGQPPFIWPIKDPAGVNERRRQAGFTTTVEQSATALGIPYRVVTLAEVAQMPKD
ncbi:hypothetical protein MUN81_20850 [Hymenobacter sp. 5317J-9]|uniref:DUF6624 domain-containing protein n=1 Tax=Hymenobacter sp. 5317J-9 TaxID=2932250 RepID=UPI001FD64A84|nr:DUF6624 domain-containing protein [Hymenobacter sp. 5317J-9]UOQ97664.1 hypothetical protein MUN81_20850 [Hymenobacter sp. 5317J-9]